MPSEIIFPNTPGAQRRTIPDAQRLGCTSYRAGHNVHWIQALHTANRPEVEARSWDGQLVSVEGETLTVRKSDGTVVRFRNHDPERLVAIVENTGDDVLVNDQYTILRVGSWCFSVARDGGQVLGRCPTDSPPDVM